MLSQNLKKEINKDLNAPPVINNSSNKLTSPCVKKLFYDPKEDELPVVSIIFTFHSGHSYDHLYSSAKQQAPEGTRVVVYSVDLDRVDEFLTNLLSETPSCEEFKEINSLIDIEPDCVLFNFECCSGCEEGKKEVTSNFYGSNISKKVINKMGNFGFTSSNTLKENPNYGKDMAYGFKKKEAVLKLLQHCIDKGYYVMFGDFSVKAIINDWNSTVLGPNPFVKLGECSNVINLTFDPNVLKQSESNQMRIVGDLCRDGKASIHCMASTIVFGVNKVNSDNTVYKFSLLTKAETGLNVKNNTYSIDEQYSVGHASLKYKSGSMIFFSAGHWIDLKNINVDYDKLKDCVKNNIGVSNKLYFDMMDFEKKEETYEKEPGYEKMKSEKKNIVSRDIASKYIQQTSNCNYAKAPKMYKK